MWIIRLHRYLIIQIRFCLFPYLKYFFMGICTLIQLCWVFSIFRSGHSSGERKSITMLGFKMALIFWNNTSPIPEKWMLLLGSCFTTISGKEKNMFPWNTDFIPSTFQNHTYFTSKNLHRLIWKTFLMSAVEKQVLIIMNLQISLNNKLVFIFNFSLL